MQMSSEHNMREYSRKRKREQKHDSNLNDTSDDICDDDDDDQPLSAWIRGGKSSTGSDKSSKTLLFCYINLLFYISSLDVSFGTVC